MARSGCFAMQGGIVFHELSCHSMTPIKSNHFTRLDRGAGIEVTFFVIVYYSTYLTHQEDGRGDESRWLVFCRLSSF